MACSARERLLEQIKQSVATHQGSITELSSLSGTPEDAQTFTHVELLAQVWAGAPVPPRVRTPPPDSSAVVVRRRSTGITAPAKIEPVVRTTVLSAGGGHIPRAEPPPAAPCRLRAHARRRRRRSPSKRAASPAPFSRHRYPSIRRLCHRCVGSLPVRVRLGAGGRGGG